MSSSINQKTIKYENTFKYKVWKFKETLICFKLKAKNNLIRYYLLSFKTIINF